MKVMKGGDKVGKKAADISKKSTRRTRPAASPEARENQLIAAAVDLAEKQILEGTASSQIITHYLKLASSKEKVELELLKAKRDLAVARTEAIESSRRMEELYSKAISAIRSYNGQGDYDDGDDSDL